MNHHELVDSYFLACSGGTAEEIAGHFCGDAVVYDLNHEPVRGAAGIGDFYVRVRDRWGGATWLVDTYLGDEQHAAGEWSMHGTADGTPFVVRGSEHYEFEAGKIAQIRQYWKFDPSRPGVALRGYPYAQDGRFSAAETSADAS